MPASIEPQLLNALKANCPYLGTQFDVAGPSRLRATSSQPPRLLFAKYTSPVPQVVGEAESLAAMERACSKAGMDIDQGQGLVPRVHTHGKADGKAYLVTDYADIQPGLSTAAQKTLGKKLAQMHLNGASENGQFGFHVPTHCGETEQDNAWNPSWQDFWADQRIGELVKRIDGGGGDKELVRLEKEMRTHVYPLLLDSLGDVKPAIIHGDLWSGNAGQDAETGQPVIFDPSSYYAHNEAELGIMKMFGGFSSSFFEAYHSVVRIASPCPLPFQDWT